MSAITLDRVHKSYGQLEVMSDISMQVEKGEFIVFVGPSGCGKSTLLRMIAGLEQITSGDLHIADRRVNDVRASKRGVAMVFQNYALYPHMSVEDNMSFSLKLAGIDKPTRDARVRDAAEILQLTDYLKRRPKALSGGQRQRVAIGRAIVRHADIFLFDEPLSNLDAALRVSTRVEIAQLKERLPETTMIYVTHDQTEAMTLADRIVVLNRGRVEQIGTPQDLYHAPRNKFVAGFIGSPAMNFLPCRFDADTGLATLADTGRAAGRFAVARSGDGHVGIRPEAFELCSEAEALVSGTLELAEYLGDVTLLHIRTGSGQVILAKLHGPAEAPTDGVVHLKAASGVLHAFDTAGKALVPG